MWLDHVESAKRQEEKEAFDKWFDSYYDRKVTSYIQRIIHENENMEKELKEYKDFFAKLSILLPPQHVPYDFKIK